MTNLQLPLLPPADDVPAGLLLPERTRRLGLVRVAKARAVLDEAARRRAELEAHEAARADDASLWSAGLPPRARSSRAAA